MNSSLPGWLLMLSLVLATLNCGPQNPEAGAGAGAGAGAEQPQGPPPPQVTVAKPLIKNITEWDEFIGRFRAKERVEIRARVSGYLDEIRFTDGQFVQKGDVLFVIDQRPFQIALDQAKADLLQSNAQLDLARKEFERVRSLRETRAVSVEEVDRRTQELEVAKARVVSLESTVDAAALNLEFTVVKAPISGRISERRVTVGNLIGGGTAGVATLLTTIVSLDPIYFYTEASEGQLLKYIRLNKSGARSSSRDNPTPVFVKLLNETDFVHEGAIDFVDNEVDADTGTLQARAVFSNEDGAIEPGLFGRARIAGSASYDALLVPDSAIITDQTRKLVFTIAEGGIVAPRPVVLGPLYENRWRVIREGLGPDDIVMVTGLAKVRPGMPVQPNEMTMEEAVNPANQQQ